VDFGPGKSLFSLPRHRKIAFVMRRLVSVLSAPTFLIYFLTIWGAAAITIAVLEGQPGNSCHQISDRRGNFACVPSCYGLRVPSSDGHTIFSCTDFLGFQYVSGQGGFTQIIIPWWFLIACASVAPAYGLLLTASTLWKLRKLWARRRLSRGRCPVCGYDLRATPNQCPECGTIPATELEPLPTFEMV
jgi:hypothetical protein